ncbi:MAG: hypothetical protein ACYS0D_06035 [Planctomycetota bacterium]
MRRRVLEIGACIALCAFIGSCATRQPLRGQEAKGLDRKLSTYAYFEEGDIITLIVDTRPARDKDGQPYVPFELAVANHGLRRLALTLESFTLIDKNGNRYPAATPRELLQGYDMLDFDRNLAELEGIVFNRFGAMARYPSNFSPTRTTPVFGSNIVRDIVALPKHGYIIDFIYFPAPQTGLRDQQFELFLDSPDLADPVFIKFEIR